MSEALAEIANVEDPGLKVHMQSRFLRTSHAFTSTCVIAQHISMYIDSQPTKQLERSAWLSFVGPPRMTDIVMPGFHVIFRGFSSPHETGPTPPPA